MPNEFLQKAYLKYFNSQVLDLEGFLWVCVDFFYAKQAEIVFVKVQSSSQYIFCTKKSTVSV